MTDEQMFRFIIRQETEGLSAMLRSLTGKNTRDNLLVSCDVGTAHAEALRRGIEHCEAAGRCLPVSSKSEFLKLHAHVKAAGQYLEVARDGIDGLLAGGDGDAATVADDVEPDPEQRAIRETTRAAAAVTLAVAGEKDAAARLISKPPKGRR